MSEPLNLRELISGSDDYNTQMLYFTCSSLSADDRYLYLISDRTGVPNVFRHDLETGQEMQLTHNTHGTLKSYVYFEAWARPASVWTATGTGSITFRTVRSAVLILKERSGF